MKIKKYINNKSKFLLERHPIEKRRFQMSTTNVPNFFTAELQKTDYFFPNFSKTFRLRKSTF